MVKNLLSNAGNKRVVGLMSEWEDLLEEEIAIHPRILAWKDPWTEESGGLQSIGSQSRT